MSAGPTMITDPRSVDPLPKVWDENSRVGDMLKGRRGLVIVKWTLIAGVGFAIVILLERLTPLL